MAIAVRKIFADVDELAARFVFSGDAASFNPLVDGHEASASLGGLTDAEAGFETSDETNSGFGGPAASVDEGDARFSYPKSDLMVCLPYFPDGDKDASDGRLVSRPFDPEWRDKANGWVPPDPPYELADTDDAIDIGDDIEIDDETVDVSDALDEVDTSDFDASPFNVEDGDDLVRTCGPDGGAYPGGEPPMIAVCDFAPLMVEDADVPPTTGDMDQLLS